MTVASWKNIEDNNEKLFILIFRIIQDKRNLKNTVRSDIGTY